MNDHLTEKDLAARWHIHPITLNHWRWSKRGPRYMKIGRRILYRLEDVKDFEHQQLQVLK